MSTHVQVDTQQYPSTYFTDDFISKKVACILCQTKLQLTLLEGKQKTSTTKGTEVTFFFPSFLQCVS